MNVRKIQGFPAYSISDNGDIFSTASRWRPTQPRLLGKYSNGKSGHLFIRLRQTGKAYKRYIHRLVAEHFIGPPPTQKHEIRHLDGNPRNNHFSNLAWGTRADNVRDAKRHGTAFLKGREIDAKLTDFDVVLIKQRLAAGEFCRKIASDFPVSRWAIHDIKQGRTWA
jgi:hypothetical protein